VIRWPHVAVCWRDAPATVSVGTDVLGAAFLIHNVLYWGAPKNHRQCRDALPVFSGAPHYQRRQAPADKERALSLQHTERVRYIEQGRRHSSLERKGER